MLVGEGDARVDEGARGEDGTGLLGGGLEGEVREEGGGGVVGEVDVEDVGGGMVDCADDELTDARGVLDEVC